MTFSHPPCTPSALARLFFQVPQAADIIVYDLEQIETVRLMLCTEKFISSFCNGLGGGLKRILLISQDGENARRLHARSPSPPRLPVEKWRERLVGKRLVAEDAEDVETVSTITDTRGASRSYITCFQVLRWSLYCFSA